MSLALASVLAESAIRHPNAIAVVMGDTRISYAELWEQARRYAAVLADHGIGPADTVALLMPDVPDFPRVYYAALALGAVVVPVQGQLSAPEIAFVLADCGASVLVAAGPLVSAGVAGARAAEVPVLVTMAGGSGNGDHRPADRGRGGRSGNRGGHGGDGEAPVAQLDVLAAAAVPVETYARRAPDDPAVVLYTAGTTRRPIGAVHSQLSMTMAALVTATSVLDMRRDDVVLGSVPLSHPLGQTVAMHAAFLSAATTVLMPRFEPGLALAILADEGATVLAGAPATFIALLTAARRSSRRPDRMPALRTAISGGSTLPAGVSERFRAVFGSDIAVGYGLAETAGIAAVTGGGTGGQPATIGRPVWGTEAAIADPGVTGPIEPLGAGEVGEIVLRGPQICVRFTADPESRRPVTAAGWLRTGDLGTIGSDGSLTLVGRVSDQILRAGRWVPAREVEEALAEHPSVAQVAVVGFDDRARDRTRAPAGDPTTTPPREQEICAVVVPAGAELTAEALIAWSRDRLGERRCLQQVEFVHELPRGPFGAVLKRGLLRRLSEHDPRRRQRSRAGYARLDGPWRVD